MYVSLLILFSCVKLYIAGWVSYILNRNGVECCVVWVLVHSSIVRSQTNLLTFFSLYCLCLIGMGEPQIAQSRDTTTWFRCCCEPCRLQIPGAHPLLEEAHSSLSCGILALLCPAETGEKRGIETRMPLVAFQI
ncbi:hypothetical protein KIL84_007809 [Mauremys mutica]|uniref:Uncharacterized protein n=1 Tax=Mauremys mutica TaxID=74926 RepID=A0A9D3X2K4_9SAUR|nr:hypothetical protein KIL84_007809 [Mauremys mutica]